MEGTLTQQSRDAILLCKYEMCSKELSQHPQLLLPCARVASWGQPAPWAGTRSQLKEVKQFRKTANMIEQQPWAMHDGSNYLKGLCDRSERADFPTPAPLGLYKIRQHEIGLETLSGHGKLNGAASPRNGPKTLWSPMPRLMRRAKWMLSKMLKLRERNGLCSGPRPKLPKGSVRPLAR